MERSLTHRLTNEFIAAMKEASVHKFGPTVSSDEVGVKNAMYGPVEMLAGKMKLLTDEYVSAINDLYDIKLNADMMDALDKKLDLKANLTTVSSYNMTPSENSVMITVTEGGSSYIPPANGYIHVSAEYLAINNHIKQVRVRKSQGGDLYQFGIPLVLFYDNKYHYSVVAPVAKGANISINVFGADDVYARFIYAKEAEQCI